MNDEKLLAIVHNFHEVTAPEVTRIRDACDAWLAPADLEVRALEVCVAALLRIDSVARARVLEYVNKRFEEDA